MLGVVGTLRPVHTPSWITLATINANADRSFTRDGGSKCESTVLVLLLRLEVSDEDLIIRGNQFAERGFDGLWGAFDMVLS